MMLATTLVVLIVSLFPVGLLAQEFERKEIALTVYNQNFALVRDVRLLDLRDGINRLRFSEIASQIDPASVLFKSLSDPSGPAIIEQNFEYDLMSADKLLLKYVDKEITVITRDDNIYQGFLASYDAKQLVLAKDRNKGPIFMVNRDQIRNIEFPALPEGLITRPTLVWSLLNKRAGEHTVELSYLTSGINWLADYVASVSEDEKYLLLTGWVTLDNRSGAGYEDASLKLIAGEVRRVQERPSVERDAMVAEARKAMAAPPQFEEKSFFEYHLYTLQRKTTIKNNQTKQITLLTAADVPVTKVYTYDGALLRSYHYDNWQKQPFNKKVAVNMEFKNSRENNLGIPLPRGKVKVYKADTDGTLQFIGEDRVDHTPKDEKVTLFLGNAFDIVGTRKITDHKRVTQTVYRDSYEIVLRNHKREQVTVKVIERAWGDWNILQASHKYSKKDAFTMEFDVLVPRDGEVKVTYTAESIF